MKLLKSFLFGLNSLLGRGRARRLSLALLLLLSGQAQAFQLQAMDASRVDLNDYVGDGEWTLVMFWSTDCIPCEQQKPMIEAFHRDHAGRDARVVGIALDGMELREQIQALIDRHQPSYPNLVVFTDVFHRQYKELTGKDFRATPTYLLYNPAGELAGARSGVIERALLESVVKGG
ncbi:TlpA family protein disulfide reductase [Granulosicoccus sp. 3-233]|uniref:TlpA family protein disulfide reductase n=1 Tax=Granulosicoccus sp. 3-233 TaxID=3417969 RepID=UPI003D34DD0F